MDLSENIAKNINAKRKELSIDRLSILSNVPSSTLWKIVRKESRDVKISTLYAIATALKCTVDDLLKG
ncbi:MAG: helix-turn-helix transcriptional regulator [Candidatus Margulisiibacteriota bacterium]|jgi:DNA-binding Xre family transcriptional regulator